MEEQIRLLKISIYDLTIIIEELELEIWNAFKQEDVTTTNRRLEELKKIRTNLINILNP